MLDYGQQGAQTEESHEPPAPVGGVGVGEGGDAPRREVLKLVRKSK